MNRKLVVLLLAAVLAPLSVGSAATQPQTFGESRMLRLWLKPVAGQPSTYVLNAFVKNKTSRFSGSLYLSVSAPAWPTKVIRPAGTKYFKNHPAPLIMTPGIGPGKVLKVVFIYPAKPLRRQAIAAEAYLHKDWKNSQCTSGLFTYKP